jgi:hypothetical protein
MKLPSCAKRLMDVAAYQVKLLVRVQKVGLEGETKDISFAFHVLSPVDDVTESLVYIVSSKG